MSYVVALPEMMSAAATDVASIGSVVATANRGVAGATTGVLAAAEDEVSLAIAGLFSAHGQGYQALSAQAAAFHERFVQALTGASGAYAAAEAANASPLAAFEQAVLGVQQEIQQIPTTLAAGFSQELDFLFSEPGSPLLALFTGNNPLLGLFIGNTPPQLLPLLLGETVQHTTYNGMSVVQITPAHPDRRLRGRHSRWRVYLSALNLPLARLHGDGLPDRRDHRSADLPVAAARRYRRHGCTRNGRPHLLGNRSTRGPARQRDRRLRGRQPRTSGRRIHGGQP